MDEHKIKKKRESVCGCVGVCVSAVQEKKRIG